LRIRRAVSVAEARILDRFSDAQACIASRDELADSVRGGGLGKRGENSRIRRKKGLWRPSLNA